MVESIEFLDFCVEPVPEKKTIPLHSWQTISLSDIWIPSHLLFNRNKGCNTGGTHGLYHTLQKKDASKYFESFSVYIDSDIKNEEEDVFLSDSDEEACNYVPTTLKKIKSLSDILSLDSDNIATHFPESFNPGEKKDSENLNNNASFRKNDDSNYSDLKTSNVNNLLNYDEQKTANMLCFENNPEKSYRGVDKDDNVFIQNIEKIDCNKNLNSVLKSELSEQFNDVKNMQTLKKNKDSDSYVSLNGIINDDLPTSLKHFFCVSNKKKDFDYSSNCDKQKSKKTRKDKKGKKLEKSVPLDLLFEDMDVTQEFNCNRYLNNIIQERERCARIGDNPLCCKEEYPDLTSEEIAFIHSDNTVGAENVTRGKYAKLGDDSLYSNENIILKPEELTFVHVDNKIKEENVKFTPTFSFMDSDEETKKHLLEPSCENDLNIAVENVKVEEISSNLYCGKIVIENIPLDVCKDDISSILCGYGEIKNFTMISTEKCLKVFVEIDLNVDCDIDWVIECLNESEPFGTSTGVLKCYQQTE